MEEVNRSGIRRWKGERLRGGEKAVAGTGAGRHKEYGEEQMKEDEKKAWRRSIGR